MHYHHLTQEERYQVYIYRQQNFSMTEIAKRFNRSVSLISRELSRNQGLKGYRPKQTHELYLLRRQFSHKKAKLHFPLKKKIESYLRKYYSPKQISGYLKRTEKILISHESIYPLIKKDYQSGGNLYKYLRHSNRKRRKKYGSYNTKEHIKDRVFIDDRPKSVEFKTRFGDWEVDTMIGQNHKGVLLTLVERKSKCKNKTSQSVTRAILKLLEHQEVRSITSDNGKEFA